MLGFPIHYSQGLRLLGFQLFGFYCKVFGSFEPQGTALGGGGLMSGLGVYGVGIGFGHFTQGGLRV